MAHKKAAGSAKNLRDSKPKYRGVKVYGGQPVKAGDIIIRQKGDTYKLGSNVYKSKDFSIHASVDGTVQFGKKNYTRFDGKVYLRTFVEVIENIADASKKTSSRKTTNSQKKATTTSSYSKEDLSGKTVAELTDIAKEMNLSGYSSLKKAELIDFIYDSLS